MARCWMVAVGLTGACSLSVAASWSAVFSLVGLAVPLANVCGRVALVTLGALLSMLPGGLGVSGVLASAALAAYGVAQPQAQAAALALRGCVVVIVGFGLLHLFWASSRDRLRVRHDPAH